MVGSKNLLSWRCPAVTWMATMNPWLSQTRWTFVPKPPRERPGAWSGGSWSCASLRPPSTRGPLAFFFRPGRRPAGPDDGAIDTPEVVIDEALVVQLVQQRGDNVNPGAVLAPGVEAVPDGLPRPVTLGEVTPGGAGMQDPQDAVDDGAVVPGGPPGLTVVGWVGKQRRDPLPLPVRQFVAAHGWPPFGNLSTRVRCLPILYLFAIPR